MIVAEVCKSSVQGVVDGTAKARVRTERQGQLINGE